MISKSFIKSFGQLTLSRSFLIYSVLYGITSLIVPFGVQFLVNSLALSGIWLNVFSFLMVIGFGLTISQIIKYAQTILVEFLQRELLYQQIIRWIRNSDKRIGQYFIEIFFAMKTFSKSFTNLVEIALITLFGVVVILIFHPLFFIVAILMFLILYNIHLSTKPAIKASIKVSDEKYALYALALQNKIVTEDQIESYLEARVKRFEFVRLNTLKISFLYVISQLLLLGGGVYLIQLGELSIGQLVSAEIIFANIMLSFNKLPQVLEAVYDYETNIYKINLIKELPNG